MCVNDTVFPFIYLLVRLELGRGKVKKIYGVAVVY